MFRTDCGSVVPSYAGRCAVFLCALVVLSAQQPVLAEPLFSAGASGIMSSSNNAQDTVVLPKFSELVKQLSQSVVNIAVEGDLSSEELAEEPATAPQPPLPQPPFLKRDPGNPFRSVGSGFIVNKEGYIVTNNHVIDKARKIIVRLLDDRNEYPAKIIGKDERTDLALIKIEPKTDLPSVFIGDSDQLNVGDWVLAIGNQFQLGQTVTAGIVSAKSRKVPTRGGVYEAFIQTDASINPGSSGGPLFNTRGQVVGVTTAIFSPSRQQFGGTGFNIGIGFAIPMNLVKSIITQLKEKGRVTRGMLGVIIQRVDADVAKILQLPQPEGALVADVVPNTPASKADLRQKDVIISFDGHAIRDHDDLPLLVGSTPVGTRVTIELIRAGQKVRSLLTVTELKEAAPTKPVVVANKSDRLGLEVDAVSSEVMKFYEMTERTGVIIDKVVPDSAADRGGLVRGDVILEIGNMPVIDLDAYAKVIAGLKEKTPVLVVVRRREGSRLVTVTP